MTSDFRWGKPTRKTCIVCKEQKHVSLFRKAHRKSPTTDGLQNWCKDCPRPRPPKLRQSQRFVARVDRIPAVVAADWVHVSQAAYENWSGRHSVTIAPLTGVKIVPNITARRYCEMIYNPDYSAHGTWTGYSLYRCRCPDCQDAANEYFQSPRGRLAAFNGNKSRRARKLALPSEPYSREDVICQQGGRFCWKCKRSLVGKSSRDSPIDHLIPLAAKIPPEFPIEHPGDVLVNVALACRGCNSKRNSKIELDAYCLLCVRLPQMSEKSGEHLELAA